MAQVVRYLLIVLEVYGFQIPFRSAKLCQQLATATILKCEPWRKAAELCNGHRSLVTPEKVISEYNKELIFDSIVTLENGNLLTLIWAGSKFPPPPCQFLTLFE